MSVAITGLGGSGLGRPVPIVSALVEFGTALHVLRDPDHHGAGQWAAGVRAAMSARLAAWTESWWWTTQAIRSTPFVTTAAPAEDFHDRLDQLRTMPARRLAEQLLRPISPLGDIDAALRWSRSRGPAVRSRVEALAHRPEEATEDFLRFVECSWQEWFSAEWARMRPVLADRTRRFADIVRARGAVAALTALDPSITPSGSGEGVRIAKVQSARHDVSGRGLRVLPSTLIRPHLYVADVPGHPLLLIHPADGGVPAPSTAELLRRLEVAAHRGRLEVARAIATEPRTAGEIAALWKIDQTLVTRHLRALASAGLARTTRRGRFVQYRLDADAVDALGGDLLRLLLR